MSAAMELVLGALIGMGVGALLVPLTRRELAAAVQRAATEEGAPDSANAAPEAQGTGATWLLPVLIAVSGLLLGVVILRAGWSVIAIPPLVLLLGLVQLAYCDATRFLLPKTMVHSTTALVAASVLAVAAATGHWHRLEGAALCSIGLFLIFLAINLANPAWMAFGDVRLAPAVGLGLAWISPLALFQGFFLANILAALVGLVLMGLQRGDRKTALPFGLYLAVATAVVVVWWS